jgi:hypothetical protein
VYTRFATYVHNCLLHILLFYPPVCIHTPHSPADRHDDPQEFTPVELIESSLNTAAYILSSDQSRT